ncbi:MAG TPA: hypothetical protein VJ773_02730 [Gemmatimonadales bacterium]|nr:hypothetical protein [Gemmatimonadales bacterium]
MVIPRLDRRGSSTRGCLFSLLVFVAALYYGVHIGEPFYRYYQYRDAMRTAARFAPTLSDDVLVRRILAKADELGLPPAAHRIRIDRDPGARRIVITAEYEERVELPFFHRNLVFKPRAEEPL